MKLLVCFFVLFFSVVGHATNRCSIRQSAANFEVLQQHGENINEVFTAVSFEEAIVALQKLNAVGGCSASTTNCGIYNWRPSFYLYNIVNGTSYQAYRASTFDEVVSAFGRLVQAGGCQP